MKEKLTKVNRFYSLFLSIVLLLVTVGVVFGNVTFGHGMGDISFIMALIPTTVFSWMAYLVNSEREKELMITNILFTVPFLWFILNIRLL